MRFIYDFLGNILQNGGFNTSYSVANNRMDGYAYDDSGNLLSNGLYNVMTYDAENRMSSVAGATYIYDAEGNRVEKQGVGVTDTVYFGGHPLARLSAGQWTDLIYGPTGLLAEVPGTPTGSPVYRVTDHLGSTVGNLLADGSFVNPVDRTPYGQVISGNTTDPYGFTGYEHDSESGMDYASARHYAGNMGRFVSPDPSGLQYASLANPQSFNLYAYVQNNPLRNVDPTGLTTDCNGQTTAARSDGGVDVFGNCTWFDDGLIRLEQTNHDIALQLAQKQRQAQVDPDAARIKALANGIAQNTAGFPTLCSVGASIELGNRAAGGGGSYDSNSGSKGFARMRPMPEDIGENISPISVQVKGDTGGRYSSGVTIRDPDPLAPWGQVGVGVSVSETGTSTVSLSDRFFGLLTVAVQATLGTIGNPTCQSHP